MYLFRSLVRRLIQTILTFSHRNQYNNMPKACLRDKTETYTLQKAQSQYYLRDEVPQDDD